MELFLYSDESKSNVAKKIKNNILMIIGDAIKYIENEDDIYLGCKWFDIIIDTTDDLEFNGINEQFNVFVNVDIDINVYSKTYNIGVDYISKLMQNLIKDFNHDILFLDECSKMVLRRKKEVEIDFSFWGTRLNDTGIKLIW